MILNHERRSCHDWDDARPSLCPDCGGRLLARRGEVVRWHWAHCSDSAGGGCGGVGHETGWHLAWKDYFRSLPGWEIEVPFALSDGRTYRADAANVRGRKIREFVHSLSDAYVAKHTGIRASRVDCLWIFDGGEFAAQRQRGVRGGGVKHLLKPKARMLHSRVGGLVHYDGGLWREWKADVWFEADTALSAAAADIWRQVYGRR